MLFTNCITQNTCYIFLNQSLFFSAHLFIPADQRTENRTEHTEERPQCEGRSHTIQRKAFLPGNRRFVPDSDQCRKTENCSSGVQWSFTVNLTQHVL